MTKMRLFSRARVLLLSFICIIVTTLSLKQKHDFLSQGAKGAPCFVFNAFHVSLQKQIIPGKKAEEPGN